MKKIRIKADVSKVNGFKIWKHCDEVGADTDGHIYQKIKGVWYYAYEYVNKWGKCKLIPRCTDRVTDGENTRVKNTNDISRISLFHDFPLIRHHLLGLG